MHASMLQLARYTYYVHYRRFPLAPARLVASPWLVHATAVLLFELCLLPAGRLPRVVDSRRRRRGRGRGLVVHACACGFASAHAGMHA
jgi:hypothetical protein